MPNLEIPQAKRDAFVACLCNSAGYIISEHSICSETPLFIQSLVPNLTKEELSSIRRTILIHLKSDPEYGGNHREFFFGEWDKTVDTINKELQARVDG